MFADDHAGDGCRYSCNDPRESDLDEFRQHIRISLFVQLLLFD